jgi:hypothetical protein
VRRKVSRAKMSALQSATFLTKSVEAVSCELGRVAFPGFSPMPAFDIVIPGGDEQMNAHETRKSP